MRTLPAAITNALASTAQQPTLTVTARDVRTTFTSLATGTPAAVRTAAQLTSAGTVLRSAVGQGADPNAVSIFRTPSPTTAASWTGAASTITSNAVAHAGSALAQTGSTIRCFYQRNTDLAICYRDSIDDGVTWGAEAALPASPLAIGNFCWGIAAPSTTEVFASFAAYDNPNTAAALIERCVYSAGAWGAWANGGPIDTAWGQIRGLAVAKPSTVSRLVAGFQTRTQQSGFSSGTYTHNGTAAGSWSVMQAMDSPNLGLSISYPSISYDGTTYWATTTLIDDGTVSGAVTNRTSLWRSTDGITWSIAGALGALFPYGASVLNISGTLYVFDNRTVYQANAIGATLDLSVDVLDLRIAEAPDVPATATIVLDNDQGQYVNAVQLAPNTTIQISIGYSGTVVATHLLYLDQIAHQAVADSMHTVLTCRGVMKHLDQVNSRFLALSGKTIPFIIRYVCAQAGVTVGTIATTAQFSQVIPCFVLTPGETWLLALKRLGSVYGYSMNEDGSGAVNFSERQSTDASVWSYGSEILSSQWGAVADQSSLIRVVGTSSTGAVVFVDLTDDAQLASTGSIRYRHIVERMLTTAAQCRIKASIALRDEQTQATEGSITVAVNPGLQVYDVVTITDARVGLAAQAARIESLLWIMDWRTGQWEQHARLALP